MQTVLKKDLNSKSEKLKSGILIIKKETQSVAKSEPATNTEFNLKLILDKFINDENKFDFDYFLSVIKQKQSDEEFLKIFLVQLRDNVHMLDPKLFENSLVNFVFFEINWFRSHSLDLLKYLQEFLIDLNSAYTSYIYKCLAMLIKHFHVTDKECQIAAGIHAMSHTIIRHLVKIAPSCKTHLIKQIDSLYPYMNKDTSVQRSYVKNVLKIIDYLSEMRLALLEICVQKILKIDVNCRREQILEAELEEVEAEANKINADANNNETNEVAMRHQLADRLDVMMEQLFFYIKSNCTQSEPDKPEAKNEINWEMCKLIYKDFLFVFDKYVLSTYGSSHVQFLMFHVCSYRGMLAEGFVDYLWKKFNYPTSSPVTRQICAYYIGSLLARAKFIQLSNVVASLQLMVAWLKAYVDKTLNSNNHANFELHRTFYALCQTVFYVIIFRHRQLFQENQRAEILDLVKSWKLNSLVTSKLNPLKYCMKTVRKKFARIAYVHQLAFCYTIMDANNRMSIPEVNEAAGNNMFFAGDSMLVKSGLKAAGGKQRVANFENPLDSFFPFDPYLLKRSKCFVENVYQEFQDDLEDEAETESEEDDDDDDDEDDEQDEKSDDDNVEDDDDEDEEDDDDSIAHNDKRKYSINRMDDSDIDENTMDE